MVCARWIKRGWVSVALFLSFSQLNAEDNKTVYWYVNGEKQEWTVNEQAIAFRYRDKSDVHFSDQILKNLDIVEKPANKMVSVKFNENISSSIRYTYLQKIKNENPALKPLVAINYQGNDPVLKQRTIYIDDQVLIMFKKPLSKQALKDFETRYELEMVSQSETDGSDSFVYVFRCKNVDLENNSAVIAAHIYESQPGAIAIAQPNRVNLFEPQSTNDSYIDMEWHVENNGQPISCSSLSGESNADAHVTDAWNMGYTGQGIKVGVIDFYGFDYNHPDMQGQFLPGWDCINNSSYNASNFYFTDASQAHGMSVAGVIGAIGNNGVGAAGVAYGAKVIPFLIDGSEASVILAFQKALDPAYDVDVINCSFGSYFPSPAIEAEIENVIKVGRVRFGVSYGMVVVASHGNDSYSDVDHPQYPSAYEKVISVAASTPDDKKKNPDDSWNTGSSWGTNYGPLLHLAAPGVCIFTTDISGSGGYTSGDYVSFQKTSAAAPIVSGVAALLLSKNPLLKWDEVISTLTQSADKVNSGTYNYNFNPQKPGLSQEMGYGRINAYSALMTTPVGISSPNATLNEDQFKVESLSQNQLNVKYHVSDKSATGFKLMIYDLSGKMLKAADVNSGKSEMSIDISQFSAGMYFALMVNQEEDITATRKFIKSK